MRSILQRNTLNHIMIILIALKKYSQIYIHVHFLYPQNFLKPGFEFNHIYM